MIAECKCLICLHCKLQLQRFLLCQQQRQRVRIVSALIIPYDSYVSASPQIDSTLFMTACAADACPAAAATGLGLPKRTAASSMTITPCSSLSCMV
jgi:hypothetical protein